MATKNYKSRLKEIRNFEQVLAAKNPVYTIVLQIVDDETKKPKQKALDIKHMLEGKKLHNSEYYLPIYNLVKDVS